jgi:MFS transporter, UMF1 family
VGFNLFPDQHILSLIPKDTTQHASFFSFYDVTEKIAIVLGTFSYGVIEQITGEYEKQFFGIGFVFLCRVGFFTSSQNPQTGFS